MELQYSGAKILLIKGDITEQSTDAIVNAANSSLMGGGGVDGAIHLRGGPSILRECEKIRSSEWPNGLPTGKAVITTGGNLKAKFVIHTVGPVWQGGDKGEAELLAECYKNSLNLAVSSHLKSIAFPAISTGAYNYPLEQASIVALNTAKDFLDKARPNPIKELVFVLFSTDDLNTYQESAKKIFKDYF
jgi:O-acetyl-ADP-ribose deacetylase (regulator of RNase III)